METKPQPSSFKDYLPAFLTLLISGAVGLFITVTLLLPTLGPRWLFFFFIVLLVSGLFLPFTYFLNLRFPSNPPANKSVVIRQSIWFGAYIATVAWLQLGRVLTLPLAVVLALAFILIELLLRLWERSRWKPQEPTV